MILQLHRTTRTDKSTIGKLYINDEYFCYTLEDVERDAKIYGKTAIPKGLYKVILTRSERFKRVLPLLLEVPGFAGIRIHPLNTAEETEGCIGVGFTEGKDFIGQSQAAMHALMKRLEGQDDIQIVVV